MAIRNIPNNIEAEKAVIGAMFLSKSALQKASELLGPDYFYLNSNAVIFECIQDMANQKIPVDLTTVTTELNNKNKLKEAGGVEYLTEILESVPSAANIDQYIKSVEDSAVLRNLIEVSTNITSSGYNTEKAVEETLDEAERKILSVVKNRRASEFRSIQEVLAATQKNLEMLSKTKGEITGLSTGWTDIDRATTGFHNKQLIIVAARPSMGKSAWALNLATNVALNNDKAVAIFSIEMGAEQLVNRMIASLGQLDSRKLSTGKLLNEDWKRVNEAISQLSETNIYGWFKRYYNWWYKIKMRKISK